MLESPIKLTDKAVQEIKNIYENKNIPKKYGLRIGIRQSSGCSVGIEDNYIIGFDESTESDEVFNINEIEVYIDKKHMMYILGVKVDFINTAEKRGFVFIKR